MVIDNKANGSLKFSVKNKKDLLNIIIPFFDKYNLKTSKNLDFQKFKKILCLTLENKVSGVSKIKDLHYQIEAIRISKREDIEIYNYSLNTDLTEVDNGWIAGFIEGDGSFQSSLSCENAKTSLFYPSLEITQKYCIRPRSIYL